MYSSLFNLRHYATSAAIIMFLVIFSTIPILLSQDVEGLAPEDILSGDYLISSSTFQWPAPGCTRITSTFGPRIKPTARCFQFPLWHRYSSNNWHKPNFSNFRESNIHRLQSEPMVSQSKSKTETT